MASSSVQRSDPSEGDFGTAWQHARSVPGWLTEGQARMLWDAVRRLDAGATVVEIGSHQGRSTIILGFAARTVHATVTAIDPFVDGRLFGGQATRARFEANIATTGLGDVVSLVPGFSTRLRPGWRDRIDLLYIDGKHDYWTFTDDLRWSAMMPPDAEILVHDCFSSVGVTSGAVLKVLAGSGYTYLDRSGSLALLRVARPTGADRMRFARQLPWFLRNVVIKVLLRLRLRPVAALFGHRSVYDPY
jgi:hypothetical protein